MKKSLIDLAERAGATFAQAFLAIEVADQANVAQVGALKTAAYAGLFAVAKYGLVKANAYLAPAPAAAAPTVVYNTGSYTPSVWPASRPDPVPPPSPAAAADESAPTPDPPADLPPAA